MNRFQIWGCSQSPIRSQWLIGTTFHQLDWLGNWLFNTDTFGKLAWAPADWPHGTSNDVLPSWAFHDSWATGGDYEKVSMCLTERPGVTTCIFHLDSDLPCHRWQVFRDNILKKLTLQLQMCLAAELLSKQRS